MTGYVGTREAGKAIVLADGRVLNARRDLRNHSPDGFEWGYFGSGPAQLALAILAHATGDDRLALSLYQKFKLDVVSLLPREGWTLTRDAVLAWCRENGASPGEPAPTRDRFHATVCSEHRDLVREKAEAITSALTVFEPGSRPFAELCAATALLAVVAFKDIDRLLAGCLAEVAFRLVAANWDGLPEATRASMERHCPCVERPPAGARVVRREVPV